MKNYETIIGIDIDDLFEVLEEKNDYKEIKKIWNEKVITDSRFTDENGYFILLKSNDLGSLLNILDLKVDDVEVKTLSEIVGSFCSDQCFGIKKYDCFHFDYNEAREQLIMYFDDSNDTDEKWSNIKTNGLEKFLEKKYKEQTRVLVKNRLKELQDFVENGEIETW